MISLTLRIRAGEVYPALIAKRDADDRPVDITLRANADAYDDR